MNSQRVGDSCREFPENQGDIPIAALQIAPALLYYLTLKLTFSAQLGSLFGAIALVRDNPREQVSEGF